MFYKLGCKPLPDLQIFLLARDILRMSAEIGDGHCGAVVLSPESSVGLFPDLYPPTA